MGHFYEMNQNCFTTERGQTKELLKHILRIYIRYYFHFISVKLQAWPCTDGIQTDNTRTTISKNGANQRTYKTKLIPNRGENSLHTLKKQFRISVNISILLGEKLQNDWVITPFFFTFTVSVTFVK